MPPVVFYGHEKGLEVGDNAYVVPNDSLMNVDAHCGRDRTPRNRASSDFSGQVEIQIGVTKDRIVAALNSHPGLRKCTTF